MSHDPDDPYCVPLSPHAYLNVYFVVCCNSFKSTANGSIHESDVLCHVAYVAFKLHALSVLFPGSFGPRWFWLKWHTLWQVIRFHAAPSGATKQLFFFYFSRSQLLQRPLVPFQPWQAQRKVRTYQPHKLIPIASSVISSQWGGKKPPVRTRQWRTACGCCGHDLFPHVMFSLEHNRLQTQDHYVFWCVFGMSCLYLFSTEVFVGFFVATVLLHAPKWTGMRWMPLNPKHDGFDDRHSWVVFPAAHLLPVFVQPVMGVVGHGGQKLQEAVESIAVACREQVDQ